MLRFLASRSHCRAVIRTDVDTHEGVRSGAEIILRLIVDVRRQTPLDVIRKAGLIERVTVIGSRRVRRGRDGDAREIRPEHVLCCYPHVIRLVPLDDRIASVRARASALHAGKEMIAGERASEKRTGRLVIYGIRRIDPLHDLGVSHRQVGIWRRAIAAIRRADPIKVHGNDGGNARSKETWQWCARALVRSIHQLLQLWPLDRKNRRDDRLRHHVG